MPHFVFMVKLLLFDIQTDHLIPARKPGLEIMNNKKRTYCIVDFAVPAVKIKENEKGEKYLNLVRELRKLWNMRVTVIEIVISALGTVPRDLKRVKEKLESGGRIG